MPIPIPAIYYNGEDAAKIYSKKIVCLTYRNVYWTVSCMFFKPVPTGIEIILIMKYFQAVGIFLVQQEDAGEISTALNIIRGWVPEWDPR